MCLVVLLSKGDGMLALKKNGLFKLNFMKKVIICVYVG